MKAFKALFHPALATSRFQKRAIGDLAQTHGHHFVRGDELHDAMEICGDLRLHHLNDALRIFVGLGHLFESLVVFFGYVDLHVFGSLGW